MSQPKISVKNCKNVMMKYCGGEIVMTFAMLRLTFPLGVFRISNWIEFDNVSCVYIYIS